MILRSLHLENYKQYGLLDLEFREGLVGIIGRNGAGKSTLFEAILYCLYGKDESNKSLIRSSFADPKATVSLSLQFAVGPAEYRVQREFRGKTMTVVAELYKNDALVAKGVAPVNEEIARILNMERDAFKRSVFSGQKELSELSDTTGEARKRMVRKMLGLDTLDDIQMRMNADARDLGSQIAGQRQNLLDPEVAELLANDLKNQKQLLGQNQKALAREKKELQKAEKEYQTTRKKFEAEEQKMKQRQALQQEISRLQERKHGLDEQQAVLNERIRNLQSQQEALTILQPEFKVYEQDKIRLQILERQRQKYLNRETYRRQLAELEPQIDQCRERLQTLAARLLQSTAIEQNLTATQKAEQTLEKQIESKRKEHREATGAKKALEGKIAERQAKIRELQVIGRGGSCPTCLQPLLDAYDSVIGELGRELEKIQGDEYAELEQAEERIRQEGLALRKQQEELIQKLNTLRAEQVRFQEITKQVKQEENNLKGFEAQSTRLQVVLREIGDLSFDETEYQSLAGRLAETEPRYLQFSNDWSYVNRELPAARQALQTALESAAETEKHLRECQMKLSQPGYRPEQYELIKQALTQFGEAYSVQSGRVRELEKASLELQNQINQKQDRLAANAQIKEQINTKLEDVDLLRKLIEHLIRFKTEILEKVSPSISREASELFSRITRGKYERIHVDENFDFAIADGGLLYPMERFSGGEIDLANFCLRIAVTKAIMELSGNGQSIEFLAFDEIFGSQDEERRHEMMLALYFLQEQFRQIYIISHIDSQKDFFSNMLEVRALPGGSTVKWV